MDWCERPSPYRFLSLIQKAIELAGRVRELGAALLSAYEKGDAEYLASLRAEQEREMLALGIAIRQDQWRDADWQVQALQQTKDVNQANLLYYTGLYQNGLINNEIQNLDLTTTALLTRTGANVVEAVGEIMNIIPDPFVGAMSSGASVPVGTKLAHLFEAIAQDHADGRRCPEHHRRDGPDAGGLAAPRGRVDATRCRCCRSRSSRSSCRSSALTGAGTGPA